METRWEDEEYKRAKSEAAKIQMQNPAFAAKIWAANQKYWTEKTREQSRQLLNKSRQDSDFEAKLQAGYERYWTPEQRKIQSSIMLERRHDPNFVEAMLTGQAKYWNTYRMRLTNALEDQGIYLIDKNTGKPNRWKAVGNIITPESIAMSEEKDVVIAAALDSLSLLERQVIELLFFGDSLVQEKLSKRHASILRSALRKLATDKQLQEII